MDSIVKAKADSFSNRIINMYKHLRNVHREYVMSVQVLRSGTSIGANLAEAVYAQSAMDFVSKLSIGLKEANETHTCSLFADEAPSSILVPLVNSTTHLRVLNFLKMRLMVKSA